MAAARPSSELRIRRQALAASLRGMKSIKHSRVLHKLRDLAALALPAQCLLPAYLQTLHELIPSQRNLFDWCDAQGRLTHYYIEGPVDERIARLYFDEFHNRREAEVMLPFASALRGAATIHSAGELNTKAFFNSALYWEIWRPQGLKYRVEAIVRAPEGLPLGSLVLYRGPGEPCFSAEEEALLPAALPYLARLLLRHDDGKDACKDEWVPSAEPTETLLLDDEGRLRHASAGAMRLLLLAGDGLAAGSFGRSTGAEHAALMRLRQALQGRDEADILHASASGRYRFRALRLHALAQDDAGWLQVQITRLEPASLALERRLLALPLSHGQTSVCRLLLQGCSQPEVARRLAVAPSTVADHTRKLYKSLGVRSLQELSERVRNP